MDASAETVCNWEKDKTQPPVPFIPAIRTFLGYDPYPEPRTLRERMLAKRRTMGWTIREAAGHLGIDPGTWSEWERRGEITWERYRNLLAALLQDHYG